MVLLHVLTAHKVMEHCGAMANVFGQLKVVGYVNQNHLKTHFADTSLNVQKSAMALMEASAVVTAIGGPPQVVVRNSR